MTQLAMTFEESVIEFAHARSTFFRPDFLQWLRANLHIWRRFEQEADRIYARGRKHYSARTIGEFIRHETALQSEQDGEWKLNDHRWPDLARMYLLLKPERDGFFELRETKSRTPPVAHSQAQRVNSPSAHSDSRVGGG